MRTMRRDHNDADWPARPWIMAAIGATGGLIVHLLVNLSPNIAMSDALKGALTGWRGCNEQPCALIRLDADRLLLVHKSAQGATAARMIRWSELREPDAKPPARDELDLATARIEVRPIQRRQAFVDGKPVGDPFE